jgi:hypothetical protein
MGEGGDSLRLEVDFARFIDLGADTSPALHFPYVGEVPTEGVVLVIMAFCKFSAFVVMRQVDDVG